MDFQDGRAGIDAELVGALITAQFQQWRHLPVRPVAVDGWDNRTYRLGDDLTVRLPTAEGYAPAVAKENTWLPRLAPALPVPIPEVVGRGAPGPGYPFPWSVRRWLPGQTASRDRVTDLTGFAVALAGFLRSLQGCDTRGAPAAGRHSFHRGCPPTVYDAETRACLATLRARPGAGSDLGVDLDHAERLWDAALAAPWHGIPVWFHGDIAHGNLLLVDRRLAAVIDFGTAGVGDPACDLVIAWTFFAGADRAAFVEAVDADPAMWARARGWALWKALLVLTQNVDTDPSAAAEQLRVIDAVLTSAD